MKKVALIFIIAVLVPSLVLAWLAVRSLRDQELVFERQQELLLQGTTDRVSEQIRSRMSDLQNEFADRVESLTQDQSPRSLAPNFDEKIRKEWPLAEIGFCVTMDGSVLAPSLLGDQEAKDFREENEPFLSNRASAEVYPNLAAPAPEKKESKAYEPPASRNRASSFSSGASASSASDALQKARPSDKQAEAPKQAQLQYPAAKQKMVARKVAPLKEPRPADEQLSSVFSSDAEFRQVVGEASSGEVARFMQNQLRVMLWHRAARDPQLVFGAQLQLDRIKERLTELVQLEPSLGKTIGLALLDDAGKPMARSSGFSATNWTRPFVATEVGEALPHWEVAAYLLDAGSINRNAATLRRVVVGMIAMMLLAICAGGWILVADLKRELARARQKTDFVSNVSHELKTPLTSIRMFSELLAENRVESPEKRTQYLQIIVAEASRLTRLINNVLDFARMERGEKKYEQRPAHLDELVEETLAQYRPQLEANGFSLVTEAEPVEAMIDRDAIAQVLLNLLSNAEKYGGEAKQILVQLRRRGQRAEISVSDRGLGVPRAAEEKIFEQFQRGHDSLNSGIPGAGLGLTLARQITRAHGGDLTFARREGGGSCFVVSLPIA